jgi:hypothetical protein
LVGPEGNAEGGKDQFLKLKLLNSLKTEMMGAQFQVLEQKCMQWSYIQ